MTGLRQGPRLPAHELVGSDRDAVDPTSDVGVPKPLAVNVNVLVVDESIENVPFQPDDDGVMPAMVTDTLLHDPPLQGLSGLVTVAVVDGSLTAEIAATSNSATALVLVIEMSLFDDPVQGNPVGGLGGVPAGELFADLKKVDANRKFPMYAVGVLADVPHRIWLDPAATAVDPV